jgi:FkbM family methyltransferase
MISYAQNLEDVMLWRALKHIDNGFYVDVGAAWPDTHSVTKLFYDRSWSGINLDPNPSYIKRFESQRNRDINLPVAVSNQVGEQEFYVIEDTGLSSLDKANAEIHRMASFNPVAINVMVSTLKEILDKNAPNRDINFLKIDVEGYEKEVLLGNDWTKYRPWVLVIEATKPMSQEENYQDWEDIVLDADYNFAYADGLNRFYVAQEHSELMESFRYPPNVFDGFVLHSQNMAEAKASEAEAKASEAEAKASEAEAKASEAEAKASEAEAKASEAEAKASEAEVKASEAEAKSMRLEKQLDDWRLIVAQSQQSAIQAQLDLKQVEARLDEKLSVIGQLSTELSSEKKQNKDLNKVLTESVQQLQEQSEEIKNLNQNSHHWYLQAHNLEQNLLSIQTLYESVLNSKSWKITLPLRLVVKFVSWLVRGTYAWLTFAPHSRPRRVLRNVLIKTKYYVICRPKLKSIILKLIGFSPKLKNRLKILGVSQEFTASNVDEVNVDEVNVDEVNVDEVNVDEVNVEAVNLEHLTPRAKQVYTQLKQAVDQNKKDSI